MPVRSREFGEFVQGVLKKSGLSHRAVTREAEEYGLEISHSTVQDMKDGVIPYSEKLVAFALATGEDPDVVFVKANRPWLKFDVKKYVEARGEHLPRPWRNSVNEPHGTGLGSGHAYPV